MYIVPCPVFPPPHGMGPQMMPRNLPTCIHTYCTIPYQTYVHIIPYHTTHTTPYHTYNTIQYNTLCTTIQYNTLCTTIQYNTLYTTIQYNHTYNNIQYNTMQYNAIQYIQQGEGENHKKQDWTPLPIGRRVRGLADAAQYIYIHISYHIYISYIYHIYISFIYHLYIYIIYIYITYIYIYIYITYMYISNISHIYIYSHAYEYIHIDIVLPCFVLKKGCPFLMRLLWNGGGCTLLLDKSMHYICVGLSKTSSIGIRLGMGSYQSG